MKGFSFSRFPSFMYLFVSTFLILSFLKLRAMSVDSPELGEVLVTSDSDANLWSVAVWNPWSGSTLATYKGD